MAASSTGPTPCWPRCRSPRWRRNGRLHDDRRRAHGAASGGCMRRLTLLGATGSIGDSTLDVVARHPDRFEVVALAAHSNAAKMRELCRRFRPRYAALCDAAAAAELRRMLRDD